MDFTDCTRCESTVQESDASDGMCEACFSLSGTQDCALQGTEEHECSASECGSTNYVEMVEVPKPVLEKLNGMAKTRHPTACNRDAPNFQRVLEAEGLL